MKTHRVMVIGGTALLAAACATAPQRNEQLEQARAEVQSVAQDPDVQRAAPKPLQSAQDDLQKADAAFQRKADPEDVSYLAFRAQREAQIAKTRADETRAHDQLAQTNAERDRVLLQARGEEADRAKAEAARAQEQTQQTQQQLNSERQRLADLQTRQTQRGLELTLSSDLLFDTGSSTLKPGANLQLNRLADFMRQDPKTRIIIEGYTDSRGSAEYNEALSRRRAQSVAEALQSQGVSADRVQAVGRGKDFPVASNDTSAGRQQNRRVNIIFSDMSGQFAQGAQGAQGAQQGPTLR
jgi:outer membrane protein OmpA-like peptidoglycan-associated protein